MTGSRFVVDWTAVALADIERLAAYLVDESPGRAEAILERIINRAESLERMPQRGRTPPELRSIGDQTWREIQEPPWLDRFWKRVLNEVARLGETVSRCHHERYTETYRLLRERDEALSQAFDNPSRSRM